jgi:uncharacterized membrane protein
MKSKVVVAGHAIHPMLIVFPLGLLATSVAWDICYLASHHERWAVISFWTIVAGVIGALVAAVPGFIDWLAIPNGTRARRIGLVHMTVNLIVVALFVISLIARRAADGGYGAPGLGQLVWGWIGVGLALVGGWLGGELVETLGISVREGANPNAPSSLDDHPRRSTTLPPAPTSGPSIPAHRGV